MAADKNESDELGETLPCSVRSNKKINMVVFNRTARDVYVIWLDFTGRRVIYAQLSPGFSMQMYTYEGHPWIFEDARTGDRMLCEGEEVYIPVHDCRPNPVIGVVITNPCYSLRTSAINAIRDNIRDPDNIDSSQIPNTLLIDIRKSITLKQRMLILYEESERA